MDIFEEVIRKHNHLVSRRHWARLIARDEFKEAIQARTEELVKEEHEEVLEAIRGLHARGYSPQEIQKNCFYGNPLVWATLRREAGLPESKRGRKPREPEHGKISTYNRGCRCEPCVDASNKYQRDYYQRKKEEGQK